jgi:serine/threonine-protein kinase
MSETKTRKFGGYILKRTLGHGANGTVFLAANEDGEPDVALKVLPKGAATNGEYARRFLTEARLASHLDHPNIVKVRGYGKQEGRYYMAMDYVDGESCKARIVRQKRLDWKEAVDIAVQVTDALEAALQESIIHRDVKPENILLDRAGRVRVADLGLAKDMSSVEPLPSDTSLGTPDYMSPEQVNNSETVDFRSDIYSLGATLFHMICGKAPYTGRSAYEVMVKHVSAELPSPLNYVPDLPRGACDVMRKMMARGPTDRYQSYEELRVDLQALLAGGPVGAREFHDESLLSVNGGRGSAGARRLRRKLLWIAVGAVPLLAAVGSAIYFLVLR